MNINTTESIRESAHDIVNEIEQKVEDAIYEGEILVEAGVDVLEKDTSKIVHSLTVNTLAVGKDIIVKFHHATGEVKRIVFSGELTVEKLITHLRSLAG